MNLGKFKVIIDRQRSYLGMANFFMLSYLFYREIGFEWYYLLVIPFSIIFMWFDVRYIMPKEYEYVWSKNPIVKELRNK